MFKYFFWHWYKFCLYFQSLKSRAFVNEQFAWRHYYWYLTNEGIQYLRDFLHLPSEIVPATLKRQTRTEATRGPRPKGVYCLCIQLIRICCCLCTHLLNLGPVDWGNLSSKRKANLRYGTESLIFNMLDWIRLFLFVVLQGDKKN